MLEGLHAKAVVIEDLLGQEEEVLWEQSPVGPHLSHELEVQSFTHLLPGHPLGHHKGHTILGEGEHFRLSLPDFLSWLCPSQLPDLPLPALSPELAHKHSAFSLVDSATA